MQIKLDHIAKIEGHMGFVADIINGEVKNARLQVSEGARLIEGILLGRHYYEAPEITSRICGVCPVVHNLASIKALEAALGVDPSEQTKDLRRLMILGQTIHSHCLHLFFFSLGDFFGIASDLDLIKKRLEETQTALAVRNFGNQIIKIIGGRIIHPLTTDIGGFRKLPDKNDLLKIKKLGERILPQAIDLIEIFLNLEYPQIERETEYISLAATKEYAFYDGNIKSTKGLNIPEERFMFDIQEIELINDVAKRPLHQDKSFMVGALARINNNTHQLSNQAKYLLREYKLVLPCYNPFYNIFSQAIEIVHCVEESIRLVDKLLAKPLKDDKIDYKIKAGQGVGAVEAPRGTLYHYYEIDDKGLIKNCNLITPTVQNLANLEADLTKFLPKFKASHIKEQIKMLVRAYDPCITCATH